MSDVLEVVQEGVHPTLEVADEHIFHDRQLSQGTLFQLVPRSILNIHLLELLSQFRIWILQYGALLLRYEFLVLVLEN